MNDKVATEMLVGFGAVVDGSLWMDRIKSQLCVAFVSAEDAARLKASMNGVKWPPFTGEVAPETLVRRVGANTGRDDGGIWRSVS